MKLPAALDPIGFWLTVLFYLGSLVGSTYALLRGEVQGRVQRLSDGMLLTGFALHTAGVALTFFRGELRLQFHSNIFLFCWFLVGLYGVVLRKRIPSFSLFVSGLAIVGLGFFVLIPQEGKAFLPSSRPWLIWVHVACIFLSYLAFACSCAASLFYLVQEKMVREKKVRGTFLSLPALGEMDLMAFRLVQIGFPLLSVGLFLGFLYAQGSGDGFNPWDPKILASLLVWLVYGAYLFCRGLGFFHGRRSAYLLIVGFVLLGLTYVGLNMTPTTWHRFVQHYDLLRIS